MLEGVDRLITRHADAGFEMGFGLLFGASLHGQHDRSFFKPFRYRLAIEEEPRHGHGEGKRFPGLPSGFALRQMLIEPGLFSGRQDQEYRVALGIARNVVVKGLAIAFIPIA